MACSVVGVEEVVVPVVGVVVPVPGAGTVPVVVVESLKKEENTNL